MQSYTTVQDAKTRPHASIDHTHAANSHDHYPQVLTLTCSPSIDMVVKADNGTFAGAMALTMSLYVVAWRLGNKRGQRKEQERIEALRASGWLKEKQDGQDDQQEYVANEITTM